MNQLTPERLQHYREVLDDPAAEFWGLGCTLGSIQKDKGSGDWIQFVTDYMTAMELDDFGLLDCPDDCPGCDRCDHPEMRAFT